MHETCKIKGECDEVLCSYCRTRDASLKDKIYEKYEYLPKTLARRYMNKGIEYEDLFQVACMGLVIAIDRFDCSRGVRFSTYATPTIMGEIKRYFRDKGFIVKLPRKLYEIFRKADRIRLAHEQQGSKAPTVNEIATALKLTDSEVAESLRYGDISNIRSLEESIYNEECTLSQLIGIEDDKFLLIENHDFLCQGLRKLDEDEKKLILERYYNNKTQKAIATELGVSQMQVSRLERKVLGKLKAMYIEN